MSDGSIHQLNVSAGGVPKHAIAEGRVTKSGLEGDGHAKPKIHGGPLRALCLFALERIASLAKDGHPIRPGSVGENVTTRGLDWARITPGTRLRLGPEVLVEITSPAPPCRTIARSFSDGGFRRLDPMRAPGHSRLYAEVLEEGVLRTGDPITVLPPDAGRASERAAGSTPNEALVRSSAMDALQIAYVNVYVTDLPRAMAFFSETLGLPLQFGDADFGYASVDAGPVRLGLAQIDVEDPEALALVGRQTGVGFAVPDLRASHVALASRGVAFPMPPSKQPWGGFMALFEDPDGNVFYLDEIASG